MPFTQPKLYYIAMQAFRAAVLSDGCLNPVGRNAYFSINLSDNRRDLVQRELIPVGDLLNFLRRFVEEVLLPLGINPCSGHPRIMPLGAKSKEGKKLIGVVLRTRKSELSTRLYHEYYPDGKKTIPENFVLTGAFLGRFFMFDGCSQWTNCGGSAVQAFLCTEGFNLHSVELFEEQLGRLGIATGRGRISIIGESAGVRITILQESIDHFMKIVDPYVTPPYRYKIKYRGSCPPELSEGYRLHNNKRSREKKEEQILFSMHEVFDNLRARLEVAHK